MSGGRKAINIKGQRFGRLIVLRRDGSSSNSATWLCKCDCGKRFIAFGGNIRKGDTTSCGCFRSEVTSARSIQHGHLIGSTKENRKTTKTYRAWSNMLSRCRNPNVKRYPDYGGRGIKVCQRWLKFKNFLADMGVAPLKLTLERKDNSKGYNKRNCVWATYSTQNKNRRKRK